MAKALHLDGRFGIHERAISASLKLLQDDSTKPPSLEQIATEMRVELDEIRRSFRSGADILTAAAEQAMVKLVDRITKAMLSMEVDNYIGQFHALGHAYFDWTADHPRHFELITDNELVDFESNSDLYKYRNSLLEIMSKILGRAQEAKAINSDENIDEFAKASRSFAQTLAREIVNAENGEATAAALKSAKLKYTNHIALISADAK